MPTFDPPCSLHLAQAARQLAALDWFVIAVYFVFALSIAVYFTRRAGRSTGEFFLGGRRIGWFLAGTGMVATTFAADTPLAVTELVARNGIAGNWVWWCMVMGNMLAVFFFARLWRRAGIMTDNEFTELRYSGKLAAALRGFKAVYIGLFMNCVVLAWVNLAMIKIVQVCLPGWDAEWTVAGVLALVAVYAMLGGLLGVTVTDAFQFFFAIGGCVVLAFVAVRHAGGVGAIEAELPPSVFRFMPLIEPKASDVPGVLSITLATFVAFVAVQWWASWYPGSEPGGGGYVAQRMMSAKDEKNSVFATLWFTVAHYCVRPWPWIFTALAALALLPQLPADDVKFATSDVPRARAYRAALADNPEPPRALTNEQLAEFQSAYVDARTRFAADADYREAFDNAVNPGGMFPKMMRQYLPVGLYGLLIAAFLAAYMSTIATQLNWGTSYLVNDVYRRFVAPESSERQAVAVSRAMTLVLAVVSIFVTRMLDTVSGAWAFMLAISGGMGLVLILRWFWWRINAFAEVAAMVAPIVPYLWCERYARMNPEKSLGKFPNTLFVIVGFTTVVSLLVMYLTPPTDRAVLHRFYRRVHPGGVGWRRIAREVPDVTPDTGYGWLALDWFFGCVLVYAVLFGVGRLLLGDVLPGLGLIALGVFAGAVIWWDLSRRDWREGGRDVAADSDEPLETARVGVAREG